MNIENVRPRAAIAAAVLGLLCLALAASPRVADGQQAARAGEETPLPAAQVVIDIDQPEDRTFRMAVPSMGDEASAALMASVLRNDFRLMPGYDAMDPRGFPADGVGEGLAVRVPSWSAIGADGIIVGATRPRGDQVEIDLRFYWPGRHGAAPALSTTYQGSARRTRDHAHDFANQVLELITGRRGPFGSKIAFARREGPRRKDVYCADMDGERLHRVSRPDGISLLPSFGLGHVWFTRMTLTGMYITHGEARDARIITGRSGVHMAPAICEDRVLFTSSRDGNSEIYSAAADGSDVRRLTNDPGMDLSPACGPDGTIAFVSTRHGNPQIFTMRSDGTQVRRVTFRGSHNQTPTFCPEPGRRLLAFTGRDGNYDVFTLDLATQTYNRVTQGQGDNQDPAFSPDCRMIAFSSTRRGAPGLYLASPRGFNQTRVAEGDIESVRWGRLATPAPPSPAAPSASR